jgi:hypothetical protein
LRKPSLVKIITGPNSVVVLAIGSRLIGLIPIYKAGENRLLTALPAAAFPGQLYMVICHQLSPLPCLCLTEPLSALVVAPIIATGSNFKPDRIIGVATWELMWIGSPWHLPG